MKFPRIFFFIALFISFSFAAVAQDTLPKFSVRNAGSNRVIVGWVNPFTRVSQISIQRSHDSLKNFKTILTVADPKAVMNGFADTKAPNDHMFYRLFYVIEGGSFFFTQSKKPDTSRVANFNTPGDKSGKDTIAKKKPDFIPSFYVYTNKDGYVHINLPDAEIKKYSIKFFEEDNSPLFEIPVKLKSLTLDKANFLHAGWFFFEIYNGEKLVERHKFYLSKDF